MPVTQDYWINKVNSPTNELSRSQSIPLQMNKKGKKGKKGWRKIQIQKQEEKPQKKPRVFILYTGGTLGMKHDDKGTLTPDPNFLEELLQKMPAFSDPIVPTLVLNHVEPIIDSSDMNTRNWISIAKVIAQVYDSFDGFVIIHGTDTMAYTASALSFLLENLGKPVILTGSQIPLCVIRSDAQSNLIDSLLVAGYSKIPEVMVVFDRLILRGNRTRKINSWNVEAFHSDNFPQLGECGIKITFNKRLIRRTPSKPFKIYDKMQKKVVLLKIFPGAKHLAKAVLADPKIKGVVIEAYGSGNVPSDPGLIRVISQATKRGVIAVVTSQCQMGKVDLGQYSAGAQLIEVGCLPGLDLTSEAAFTKLCFLLGQDLTLNQVRQFLLTNLRGELTPPLKHIGY
ncbi:60 kda lysophospholipase [Anaeramoeba ignava]|uniref:asparaginase n=1 Tax=Anaeramoeba ignava TaxID=1746090 RepID=A0A9Q0REE1_ANAIG|nr:60 kda lysophospholipase [Anaeramoeba ignava]